MFRSKEDAQAVFDSIKRHLPEVARKVEARDAVLGDLFAAIRKSSPFDVGGMP